MWTNIVGHSGSSSAVSEREHIEFFVAIFSNISTLQLTSHERYKSTLTAMALKSCLAAFCIQPDMRIRVAGRDSSDFAFLELPREGTLLITLPDGAQSSSKPGTAVLTTHKAWERETRGYSGLIIRMPRAALLGRIPGLQKAASLCDTSTVLNVTADSQAVFLNSLRSLHALHKKSLRSSEAWDDLLIDATALLIKSSLRTIPGNPDGRLQTLFNRARELITDKLDAYITVSALAEEMGVSERYLQVAFKSVSGKSPKQFILTQKLEQSRKALMNDTSLTIVEVSERYGFSSPAHFSSAFKSHFGISPSGARSEWQDYDCPASHWLGQKANER